MTESLAHQRIHQLATTTLRALTGDPSLRRRGDRLHRGRLPLALPVPHLHAERGEGERGIADGIALRLRHSDDALRRSLCPADPAERLVYEMLEQFRVESLVPPTMPGMLENLRARHEQWSLSLHGKGSTDTEAGLLLFTVAQICRARITGQPVVEATEGLIESTRFALAPTLGDPLAGLRRSRRDQEAFARHAIAIARRVGHLLADRAGEASAGRGPDPRLAMLVDFDSSDDDITATAPGASAPHTAVSGYHVFTTAYDTEQRAGSVLRPELLARYRERLDRRIASSGVHVGALARRLHDQLARPHQGRWRGQQEEGHLDAGALTKLVTSPVDRAVFRDRGQDRQTDTGVTFLIDCSGSMKAHAEFVAVLVDVFVRALELADVDTEVLGFTTGAWNGGRARRDWQRAGRPRNPGRCNEVRHLVFKEKDTSWRRSRADIAALGKPDLFRESVDGEAVAWAHRRARNRDETRKILLVLSDGSPVDGATGLLNDTDILGAHLAKVVADIEDTGAVEIVGVGVGADISACYTRNRTIDPGAGPIVRSVRSIVAALA
jgi:cobaltochelatase CobT